jgi:Holliday junction resolvasome RuvABC endonuclease subunit
MRVCGIDPGANGAVCVLDSNNPVHLALLDLAKTTPFDASHWLQKQKPDIVWIEDVHSLFGMSAKSNFGFGRNLGLAVAISQIATKGEVAKTVTPKIWQKYVGVTAKGKDIKKQVAEIAIKLYPAASIYGKRGGLLDGRSDALMIAHYGLHNKEKI